MKLFLSRPTMCRRGVLTFEWMLLFVLLSIGFVIGIAATRDTIIAKYTKAAGALGALDMSYNVPAYMSQNQNHDFLTAPEQSSTSTMINVSIHED